MLIRSSGAIRTRHASGAYFGSTRLTSCHRVSSRRFLSSPWLPELPPQTLTASRTLSYPASALYDIISDVASYQDFLPYCQSSTVTRWSKLDRSGRRWPHQAVIRVGWSSFEEVAVSRIYCQPGIAVEAIIGDAQRTMTDDDIPHYDDHTLRRSSSNPSTTDDDVAAKKEEEGLDTAPLKSLYTRWTLRPFPYQPRTQKPSDDGHATMSPIEQTEVSLEVHFQFANPVYAAMSKAVAPRVASVMVEAFAKRVSDVLGEPRSSSSSSSSSSSIPTESSVTTVERRSAEGSERP